MEKDDPILELARKMGEISATIDVIYEKGKDEDLMLRLFRLNDELKVMVKKL